MVYQNTNRNSPCFQMFQKFLFSGTFIQIHATYLQYFFSYLRYLGTVIRMESYKSRHKVGVFYNFNFFNICTTFLVKHAVMQGRHAQCTLTHMQHQLMSTTAFLLVHCTQTNALFNIFSM